MSEAQDRILRQAYSEIIYGFSIKTRGKDTLYIKHFSTLDSLETDFLYNDYYNKAKNKGYPTEKDRLTQLEKDGLWTSGNEMNLEGVRAYVRSLNISKKKAFLKRDLDSINAQIQEQENLLKEMILKRERLVGATVEKFTRRSVDAYLIHKSFFQDIELKTLIYNQEQFDELEPEELGQLFLVYNETMENLSEMNIRKIALSPFFQNSFSLCEKIYEFYGRPICYLTNFQVQLAAYGSYYKHILNSEAKPPDEFLTDPEKLEDWFTSKTNVEQMLDKNVKIEEGATSIVGATKEDLKNWGYDQQGISLQKATKEAGGVMDMEQLMKLHGVK